MSGSAGTHRRGAVHDRRPLLLVGLAVLWGLVLLWPEHRDVWYLNDASVHRSMVTWAADRIRDGHLPLDGWYPYLSLGASRFHHYQALPHIVTGAVSVVTGPSTFPWSLYLLLATWPISVYLGARMLGLGRWPAATAALLSPLLVSAPGLGYEWGSYVWRGSGTWAQLWGMWLLPLAWGTSWRAIAGRGRLWVAALVLGLLVAAHLLTGYLALLSLPVFAICEPSHLLRRVIRGAIVGAGALAAAAWMLVPLLGDARWTINDEFSRGTFYYDSFGAARVLRWVVTGALFDAGRWPIITLAVGVGTVVAIRAARREESSRIILALGGLSLVLFCGRPTFGLLIDRLPGGADLFLRRYVIGVHLCGLFLAGLGATWLIARARALVERSAPSWSGSLRPVAVSVAVGALLLAPAGVERARYARTNGRWIDAQIAAQGVDGAAFGELAEAAAAGHQGRVFAGKRASPVNATRVGAVPGFAALLNLQIDGVGFTRPTWSLASGSEYRLDPIDPAMLRAFGVRSMILSTDASPPQGFTFVARSGHYVRYDLDGVTYADVVDTIAPIQVDRLTIGERTAAYLRSDLVAKRLVPTIAFEDVAAAPPTLGPGEEPSGSAGTIDALSADPDAGDFAASVTAHRRAVVEFKVAYDPRFEATVDGRPVQTQMLAPAFVGVPVEPGSHEVRIAYTPYPYYLWLLAGGIAGIGLIGIGERRAGRDRSAAGVSEAP